MLKTVMRSGDTVKGLKDLCLTIDEKIGGKITIVEIGSYMGESAEIFAEEFPDAKIYCIDPWKGGFDDNDTCSHADYNEVENQFDLRTKDYPNIIKVKDFSTNVNIPCDMVYIDGRHFYEGVKEDVLHWLPLSKKVICGHDYYTDEEFLSVHSHVRGVRKAVDEIFGKPDKIFIDGSWLKWKS